VNWRVGEFLPGMCLEMEFRQVKEQDFVECEHLTRNAFWDVYKPGCVEHFILHKIRKGNNYVNDLDLLATDGDRIIGHIICTRARVIDEQNTENVVLCAGPFSILPAHQRKGYGSKLMEYCINRAREQGFKAMILFGNPDYYHRFGFRNAIEYGIKTKEGKNFEPFMAKELQNEGLKGVRGKFYEDESFSVDDEELKEFERQFTNGSNDIRERTIDK